MIEFGCLANFNRPYQTEIDIASKNGFDLVQIWYDRDGISLGGNRDPLELIKTYPFPAIIHAVLDINEFEEHIPKLFTILEELGHRELIIHPVCKSEPYSDQIILKLSRAISLTYSILKALDVTLYVENNSQLDSLLHDANEVSYLFEHNPGVKFILDVAHIRDYEHLKELVCAKYPAMLHVADKHFDVIHEHLPLGCGELDFTYIFRDVLKDFSGKVILEIVQSQEDLIKSKKIMEEMLNREYRYFRIHTEDCAYLTKRPRGLFTAVGKLVDGKIMTSSEIEEYWENRRWFEKHLPVPPFYKDNNPDGAITWFKNSEEGQDMFSRMTHYFEMAKKYKLKLYITKTSRVPGEVIYDDNYQIAVTDSGHGGEGYITHEFK